MLERSPLNKMSADANNNRSLSSFAPALISPSGFFPAKTSLRGRGGGERVTAIGREPVPSSKKKIREGNVGCYLPEQRSRSRLQLANTTTIITKL